jgi:hypothetical protein
MKIRNKLGWEKIKKNWTLRKLVHKFAKKLSRTIKYAHIEVDYLSGPDIPLLIVVVDKDKLVVSEEDFMAEVAEILTKCGDISKVDKLFAMTMEKC